MTEPKKTPLYDVHVAAGARIVPFAGYSMPVQYSGVIEEHETVRKNVGLFDVSHMGEVEIRGPRALEVANRIISNDVERIVDGQALYTVMCKPDAGIVDDLVVYRMSAEHVFICVNASNREKDFAWIAAQAGGDAEVVDSSDDYAQIAVQGPKALELVERLADVPVRHLKSYTFTKGHVAGQDAIISRTGYTGEDGFELYVPSSGGAAVWTALMEKGADLGVKPAGLGARDSLRLEMRFALYGNDIDETTNPIEAGLGWVVKLDKKSDFVAKDVLTKIKAAGPARKLVGFEMVDRGIARHGYPVVDGAGQKVGVVTSGTHGPSVNKAIGMAYVPAAMAELGTTIAIDIRGKPTKAVVAKTPFYKRA
ncbi:glycine cleavage system aminomethyltransferase GcvT [Myxococcota bacterium]|nr:glycine cleavage system aminomethyltransferase GcvT [Myxococcota bacterium]